MVLPTYTQLVEYDQSTNYIDRLFLTNIFSNIREKH